MALDMLVDATQLDAGLSSVADAIRAKGGTSAQLAFPAGFVSAVQAIPTGGGGSGVLNMTMLASSVTTINARLDGITEINITAGDASGAKYCDRCMFYDVKLPDIADITYSGMSGLTSGTSKSDVLRQCNGIKTIDFGGVNAPASLTRFYYNISRQAYEHDYTMTIKGITWTNCTAFTNCFASSTPFSDWYSARRPLDIVWDGTVNASALNLKPGSGAFWFTHRSLLELFNALSSNGGTLTVGSDNLAQMTSEEIAIATAKGWTVT